jgi:very-short-patch-repair endonuclease
MTDRKKLIEVALPLEAINAESAREKSIRHGHPSTLHLWWARRPLAACRAVLFASLVDDPSSWTDKFPTVEEQNRERQRLFDILGKITTETDKKGNSKQIVRGLVSWDDINNPKSGVLEAAQREIARSIAWNRGDEPPIKPEEVREYLAKYAPPVYDPFCGGGSIPLEAQRLGLEAHGSDLNPVAVLITKALIEIPPKFKDLSPVNPEAQKKLKINKWNGAQGLAEDVRYYGKWMRDEAFKRIGHLYPKVQISPPHPLTPSPTRGESNSPHPLTPSPTRGESNSPHPLTPSPTRGEGEQERKEQEKWEIPQALQEKMKEIARQFRKQPTPSEAILWKALKNRQLEERKFRRQQPIGAFIVDFFCAQERLIVEIDGGIHESQKESDRQRQSLLESLGLRFVRLDATKVETDLASCLETIRATFTPLSPTPLSPRGRGAGGEGATLQSKRQGTEATVIAWLWARTVKCPNPACGCQMPLVRSFQLSTKKGKEAWVEPVINREQTPPAIQFEVKTGKGKALEGTVNRKGAICIACGTPVPFDHVRSEGKAGRMEAQLMAIVAEGDRGRIYLSPNTEHTNIASKVKPEWVPDADLPHNPRDFKTPNYGMKTFGDLFTSRHW